MERTILETFVLTPSQREAATLSCDLSVDAGAGSGKTNALTARYLRQIEAGGRTRGVTAVTFTERAAREMRNRIRKHVHAWLAQGCPDGRRTDWEEIEANLDAARIGTIHSLCAAILRAHPAEAQVDPRFDVVDEGLAATWQKEAVEDTLNWATGQETCKILFEYFSTGDLDEILAKLVRARLQSAAAFDCVSPAQAWTREVQDAIAGFANDAVVCGAVDTLRGLLGSGALLAEAGDKLAAQVQGLVSEWTKLEQALAAREPLGAAVALFTARREFMGGKVGRAGNAKDAVKVLREQYDDSINPWLGGKASEDDPPDPEMEAKLGEVVTVMRQLFDHALEQYGETKDRHQSLDFDDLEAGAQRLMQNAQVRRRWQGLLDSLLVDEFQDTNERQRDIILALAGQAARPSTARSEERSPANPAGQVAHPSTPLRAAQDGRGARLFVVGDPKQSIYRFRGADVTVFRKVKDDIEARGGRYISLDRTFRAHDALIGALNEVLANVMGREDDAARPYYIPFRKLEAERSKPRDGIREPYVEFLCGLGEKADQARPAAAQLLARRLREMHDSGEIEWNEVACLFRASTGFPVYEAALESAGIPFVTVAGRGFYERAEIRDLLNILRAAADPTDDLAMAGLLRSPAFGLPDAALYQLRRPIDDGAPVPFYLTLRGDLSFLSGQDRTRALRAKRIVDDLAAMVDRVPVAELLKQVLLLTNYPAIVASAPAGERLQRNIDKLLADAQVSGLVSVNEFLEYIETLRDAGAREGEAPAEAGGSLRLMSVHKAKGLEFPVVVLADASRGRPPFKDKVLMLPEHGVICKPGRKEQAPLAFAVAKEEEKKQADAEDLRLLYVAATRAQEKLIVCAHQRSGEKLWFNQLCEGAGIDPAMLAARPGEWQIAALPQSKQKIGFLASAEPAEAQTRPAPAAAPQPQPGLAPIYAPVPVRLHEEVDEKLGGLEDLLKRAKRRTGRPQPRDGTLVGELFHAAVQRWCFPGDPRLDGLLRAVVLEAGLGESAEADETAAYVKQLLGRLRADPLWQEIDATKLRRHEIPYRLAANGYVNSGIIDLLYQRPSGEWRVVDFKTDALAEEGAMRHEIEFRKYAEQMQRYQKAVHQLLGVSAQGIFCFVDLAGEVRWEEAKREQPLNA